LALLNPKNSPFFIAVLLAVGIYIGTKLSAGSTAFYTNSQNNSKLKLNRLIDYLNDDYVDAVNTDSIVEGVINNILQNLDPHSTYISKQDIASVNENMKGGFIGIGVHFYDYKDTISVIRAIKGGPSFRAGIEAGDRILMADNDTIHGPFWSQDKVIQKLRGPKNSKVRLQIKRANIDSLLTFEVIRSEVPIKSVDAFFMMSPTLGYIKVNRFAESTYLEFENGIEHLISKGAINLVLDLRDNPGGFLQIAEQMADEFLEAGKLILFTKNKSEQLIESYASEKGRFENAEVYVLINENSASASEIIAGALQDNDKGTIIGRRSFGKGLVQQEMALGDGSAIRLTTARYYTPTGRSIQRSYVGGSEAYYNSYYKRLEDRNKDQTDSEFSQDSLKYITPKGKVVYGGGGIIPDIYSPYDPIYNSTLFEFLKGTGVIDFFVFEQLDKHRGRYKSVSESQFLKEFDISNEIYQQFLSYLNATADIEVPEGISFEAALKVLLKSAFTKQLFGDSAAAKVLLKIDPILNKVIELESL
jgi:carboxyl-terminal processing protease|tara:strand:- start:556 stop:2148 length:1593 start_codon:yes stop_codon:yes gene_type:complete